MHLIGSKFNEGFQFLLCIIETCCKYAWIVSLKVKKGITITNAFQKIPNESDRKSNKTCLDKGRKFYNRSIESWLQDNHIKIYSTQNERKICCCWKIW